MTPLRLSAKATHEIVDIDDINSPIYRVIEVSRLIGIFEFEALNLTAPRLWDDPYENFLKYCRGIDITDDTIRWSFESYSELIFAQCWTLNEENDAVWRIYSPNKDRAKVRTTINKLFKVLNRIQDNFFRSCIGAVKYKDEDAIKRGISAAIKNDKFAFFGEGLIKEFYLVKREAFAYEKEVRLMVRLHKPANDFVNAIYQDPDNLDVCNLPLADPEELFDEIVFDPRMPDTLVHAFTSYFRNELKFKKDIYKSNLYEKPVIKEIRKSIF